MHFRRFLGMVFRLYMLLALATIASGQVRDQPAHIWIETTATGEVRATLTLPMASAPTGLPAVFARAVGCDVSDLKESPYESRILVQCAGQRPSSLTFHSTVRFGELMPLLRQAGVAGIDFLLTTPHFSSVRLNPAMEGRRGVSGDSYRANYDLDQVPQQITIDGDFGTRQVKTLAACAAGLMLAPFLLFLLRPSDPLRLRVQMEAIFVLGWICWIWVLLRVEAGALLSFLFRQWTTGPLLALMVPPIMAVWIGSRVAAVQYVRLTPSGVHDVDHYRRSKFWAGALVACALSVLLSLLLSTSPSPVDSVLVGFAVAIFCVICLRRIRRGASHPLAEGEFRKRVFELAARAAVKLRSVSILTSSTQRAPIAFAARWGVVFLNEGLLQHLSRREVDAIVCHEFSHLQPRKRFPRFAIYVLLVGSIVAKEFVPHFIDFIPLLLLCAYFLFKSWRRSGEYKADLDSIRWSADPEAMITGLARVAHAHGMPLDWHAPISWMMTHPPTMDRIRAIARAGKLSDSRITELLEESRRDAVDHYEEAGAASLDEGIVFSAALRQRMRMRLNWYVALAPVGFGLPVVWLLERSGLPWWAVIPLGSLLTVLAIYVGYEWIAGSTRAKVKQRLVARHGDGVFVGFSPAAEPRVFDGLYHYDLGLLRFVDEGLEFAGDRARFTVDRRLVRRVWLGKGARHWTPRKVVYLECQSSVESEVVVFSVQSLEAWFWPSTVKMARRLHQRIAEWYRSPANSTMPPLPCPLPRVEGSSPASFTLRSAFRTVSLYSVVAFVLAFGKNWLEPGKGLPKTSELFSSVAVCGVAALFLIWPNLRWGRPVLQVSHPNAIAAADDKAQV